MLVQNYISREEFLAIKTPAEATMELLETGKEQAELFMSLPNSSPASQVAHYDEHPEIAEKDRKVFFFIRRPTLVDMGNGLKETIDMQLTCAIMLDKYGSLTDEEIKEIQGKSDFFTEDMLRNTKLVPKEHKKVWTRENLPTYYECEAKRDIRPEELTPLDLYIINNEPAGASAERTFRDELIALLNSI
jgi:hypothetical protein